MTNTAILILVDHFQEKQGLALGISFMIMALSGIVCPQIVRGLLSSLSAKVSILIYAGILFSGLLGSFCFSSAPHDLEDEDLEEAKAAVHDVDAVHPPFDRDQHSDHGDKSVEPKTTSGWRKNPIVQMFTLINWSLLKRPYFLVTVLGSAYSFNGLLSFFLYLPLYAASIDCTTDQKVSKINSYFFNH